MATLLNTTTSKGAGNYIGETKKQLRDGFGVYNYSNRFFRYEGEWCKGKKHGHGKLLMADGSFYEGQFQDGEIQGHGFRRWGSSKNEYTGQFVKGELMGHGVMVYGKGDRYEGQWVNNAKEGQGKFIGKDGSIYEGSFHNNKKHGEGKLVYSNGDEYEGDWVNDQHQGHGVMKYHDGTIYAGQWWGDEIHGEGSIIHSSGLSYEGIWVSGRPEAEALAIRVVGKPQVDVIQGRTFGFEVECVTADGERAQEDGRLLQVTGWIRVPPVRKTPETPPENDERLPTPFGFEVEAYCLTDSFTDMSSDNFAAQSSSLTSLKPSQNLSPIESTADLQVSIDLVSESGEKDSGSITESQQDVVNRLNAVSQASTSGNTIDRLGDESMEVILPPPPSDVRTTKGSAVFENLLLPPLPPGMKAFPSIQDLTEPVRPDHSTRRASLMRWKKAGSVINPNIAVGINPITEEKEKKKKKIETMAEVVEKADSKSKKKGSDKDKNEEKLCKPGDYVIVIQDVTIPRFLGSRLQPAMLHVKVLPKKREKSKMERRT